MMTKRMTKAPSRTAARMPVVMTETSESPLANFIRNTTRLMMPRNARRLRAMTNWSRSTDGGRIVGGGKFGQCASI